MVTAANDDNTNMGNRSYTLILERASEMSTVPVEVYPNITDIYVVDDDATGGCAIQLQIQFLNNYY